MNELYEMKLHDTLEPFPGQHVSIISIVRVPGGWVYNTLMNEDSNASVFVPFSNEFNPEAV